jgi:bifunctional enzyme CysN/CysC
MALNSNHLTLTQGPVTFTVDATAAIGDLVCAADQPAEVTDQFEVQLLCLSDEPMIPERRYHLRLGARDASASINAPKYKLNPSTFEQLAAKTLVKDDISVCSLSVNHRMPFDAFSDNRATGAFKFVDRDSGSQVGIGVIKFALRRTANIH